MKECPECGSNKIISDLVLMDRAESFMELQFTAAWYRNPDALSFKNGEKTKVRATACGECGYLQTYLADPKRLWEAFDSGSSDRQDQRR